MARLLAALLTRLLAALLARLTTLLSLLLAALLSASRSPLQLLQLSSQPFHLVECRLQILTRLFALAGGLLAALLRRVERLLRFGDLVLHLVERRRRHRLAADRVASLSTPNCLANHFHSALGFRLLQVAERLTQFRRRAWLRALGLANSLLHILFELVELLVDFVLLLGQFLVLLAGWLALGPGLSAALAAPAIGLAHLLLEIRLAPGDLTRPVGEVRHLIARLLAAHPLQGLLGFGKAFGRPPATGTRLIGRAIGAPHIFGGLLQSLQRLFQLLGIG